MNLVGQLLVGRTRVILETTVQLFELDLKRIRAT